MLYQPIGLFDTTDSAPIAIGNVIYGGIVYYLDSNYAYIAYRGLITSSITPGDYSVPWGCNGSFLGATGSAIGDGLGNTLKMASSSCGASTIANSVLNFSLIEGSDTYDDWVVPTSGDMQAIVDNIISVQGNYNPNLIKNLAGVPEWQVGSLNALKNWSSTEVNYVSASSMLTSVFQLGPVVFNSLKTNSGGILPVRKEYIGPTTTTTTTTTTTAAPSIVQDGLVLWNSMNSLPTGSVWLDSSGNANHALVSGSLLYYADLGYVFPNSGSSSPGYLTYPQSLTATPSSSWTMQWFGSAIGLTGSIDLWTKVDYTNGWDTLYNTISDEFVFRDTAGGDFEMAYTIGTSSLNLYTIGVDSVANQTKLWVNGTLIQTLTGISEINTFNSSTSSLVFGINADGDGHNFDGSVRDITMYNKVLSDAEVSQNYNYLVSSSVTAPSNIKYWNLRRCFTTSSASIGFEYKAGSLITGSVGQALRFRIPNSSPAITIAPFNDNCWEVVSAASSGSIVGIRTIASNCSQSVCLTNP